MFHLSPYSTKHPLLSTGPCDARPGHKDKNSPASPSSSATWPSTRAKEPQKDSAPHGQRRLSTTSERRDAVECPSLDGWLAEGVRRWRGLGRASFRLQEKAILPQAPTWMSLGNTVSVKCQPRKDKPCGTPLTGGPRLVPFMDTES